MAETADPAQQDTAGATPIPGPATTAPPPPPPRAVATDSTMPATRSLSELSTTGILWLINRVVFHPRGYALFLHVDAAGDVTGWGLQGDGADVWRFANAGAEDRHLADVEALFAAHRSRAGTVGATITVTETGETITLYPGDSLDINGPGRPTRAEPEPGG